MKYIRPASLRPGYYRPVEDTIAELLRELIYAPLQKLMEQENPELHNTRPSVLADAIAEGRIWYEEGAFHGSFNARISKEIIELGGRFLPKSATWALDRILLPPEVSIAMAHAALRYDALRRGFFKTLDNMNIQSIDEHVANIANCYEGAIDWMEGDFQRAVRGITIAPKLTDVQRRTIADDWANNLQLYIKKWAADEILELRETVQAEAFAGRRAESLQKLIVDQYGVSERKAKFLARQETSLLMSKFHETRYSEVGITEYRWSTSKDERVRHDHKALDKLIFSFASPPVTNEKTGARNNPGCDYGCRCIAIPIFRDTPEESRTPMMVE